MALRLEKGAFLEIEGFFLLEVEASLGESLNGALLLELARDLRDQAFVANGGLVFVDGVVGRPCIAVLLFG